ncbi:MAG: transcription elongation factor GreB [Gammaproteobacteria bacterium]|nr:transcription elongation factor GreB [Pseudomonadales bacterium]MCP5345615.1 transcription elongation factor GreB [Pseudomonadales bacterium]
MSRYRPPATPSSRYISAAGEKKLKEELQFLWKVERPQVTRSVAEAAALGDRSENAEYIYGKKRLREIDRRVRYLNKRLDEVTVVNRKPDDTSRVYFGALVALEDEQGKLVEYRLLGADEINPGTGAISIDSPMGKALLGKSIDSEIELQTPAGTRRYILVEIRYD